MSKQKQTDLRELSNAELSQVQGGFSVEKAPNLAAMRKRWLQREEDSSSGGVDRRRRPTR